MYQYVIMINICEGKHVFTIKIMCSTSTCTVI